MKNAEAVNKGEMPSSQLGVTAVDDFTLKVELERPTGYFIKLTAFTDMPARLANSLWVKFLSFRKLRNLLPRENSFSMPLLTRI